MKNSHKINKHTLLKVYQNHDELYYIWKYKIIKFKGSKITQTRVDYLSPVIWKTGTLIWSRTGL